ncbi:MAG: efflux RND transporter periplasmic adaptor subunit [Hyphomicrobiales bacterium]
MPIASLSSVVKPAVLVVLLAGLQACSESESATPPPVRPPVPVLTEVVRSTAETQVRTLTAQIRPRIESTHAFRVAGRIAERLVDTGAVVRKGDPLARLDDSDLKLQLDQAKAELDAAQSALDRETAELGRARTLNGQGFTATSALQRQQMVVDEAHGRLARAERAVELATNALAYATLTAQADGVVTAIVAEPGQVVSAGQPVVKVARAGEFEAEVAVPETLVSAVNAGQATVELWAVPGRRYTATLRELSPMADPATRTFAARYTIADADADVRLGMSATLALTVKKQPATTVPISSLFDEGAGPALWIVDRAAGSVSLKPVTVAAFDGDRALIADGLGGGETIVTAGVHKLEPGQKVRPLDSASN